MKKIIEKILSFVKKCVKSLKAFPIGALMLLVTYIVVYLINGEEVYAMLISKLTSIDTLIYEIILSGITYSILYFFILYTIPYLQEIEERNPRVLKWKDLLRYLIACVVIIVVIEVVAYVEKLTAYIYGLDEEIEIIFFGLVCIILIIVALSYVINKFVVEKKLNNALKTKRNEK